jgi:lactaldehyde dehydrogenase/glycolaldehyde dehydrogenase
LLVARCFADAGLPAGVLNVVTGRGREVGEALVKHPDTQIVTLTGSVEVGQRVMLSAAEHLTMVSLELGGKAPFIVMDDADLDAAATDCVISRFRNAGQICTSNERTYVHAAVFETFARKVVEKTRALRIGDPMGDVDMGPKINRPELDKVERMVQQAIDLGARVLTGGQRPKGNGFDRGYWFEPTVLVDVKQTHPLVQEEVFGPVLPILPFENFDEALGMANDSDFGLSSYLYTNNYNHVMRAMTELDFGEVFVNRIGPEAVHGYHTGYRKSGIGGDDGQYGFETYLKKKTVYLQYKA